MAVVGQVQEKPPVLCGQKDMRQKRLVQITIVEIGEVIQSDPSGQGQGSSCEIFAWGKSLEVVFSPN